MLSSQLDCVLIIYISVIVGDTLDQDVRKCEREIRALQTTLEHLNARNAAYRESFQKIDLKGGVTKHQLYGIKALLP